MKYYNYTTHYELCKVDQDGYTHTIVSHTDKPALLRGLFARNLWSNLEDGSHYSPRACLTADGGDVDFDEMFYKVYEGDGKTRAYNYVVREYRELDPVTCYLEGMSYWSNLPDVRRLASMELAV